MKTKTVWKKDDWGFFEFKLSQIMEVSENRVVEISDGYCRCSGYNLSDRFVPLTLRNRIISAEYEAVSDRIHKKGPVGLNFPDIHRWLVGEWITAIDTSDKDIQICYDKLYKFEEDLFNAIKETNELKVNNIPLFRKKML